MTATTTDSSPAQDRDPLLERAINLFEFLGRCQQLRATPARTTDAYLREGSVHWFADLPDHPAIASTNRSTPTADDAPLLVVERVPHPAPPEASELLRACMSGDVEDPTTSPELRERVPVHLLPAGAVEQVDGEPADVDVEDDLPAVVDDYLDWLQLWQEWADQELADRQVRDLYTALFSAHLKVTNHPEELELVLGTGLLAWDPAGGHTRVHRHLLTVPVEIVFDDATGRLRVRRPAAHDPIAVELEMLDPGVIANPAAVNEVKATAAEYDGHPLDREGAGLLAQRLVHILDAQGEYLDEDAPPAPGPHARVGFAPALIVRKRSQQGLIEVFQTILHQLQATGEVPAGLLPLVDPDRRPAGQADSTPGAIVEVDAELFLPLPVNERQLQVILRVDSSAQTLVQGPPGTGKTHTAAALLSHLLAQGKRVLVTAHTDRALYEVREKLPLSIRPLAVSVVGSSRSDMADLKIAVERISGRASDHDESESLRDVKRTLDAIDSLRRERAAIHRKLIDARTAEVEERDHVGVRGTLAAIALDYLAAEKEHAWISELADVPAERDAPLSNSEIVELHGYLIDDALVAEEAESAERMVALDSVPAPSDFALLCDAEQSARDGVATFVSVNDDQTLVGVRGLDDQRRAELRRRMREIAHEAVELEGRHESWMNGALADVRAKKAGLWEDRGRTVQQLIGRAQTMVTAFGPLNRVTAPPDGRGELVALARTIRTHLAGGRKLKATANGQPKIGAFTPREVKDSRRLFETVQVDRLPAITSEAVDTFLLFDEIESLLTALDQAWPADVAIPPEDTFAERLQWHAVELEVLLRVLKLGARLLEEEVWLLSLGLLKPDWTDLESIHRFAALVDAAAAQDTLEASQAPLDQLAQRVESDVRWQDASMCVSDLLHAVSTRDPIAYAKSHRRLQRLHEVRLTTAHRDEVMRRLAAAAPRLAADLEADPRASEWARRLATFEASWRWASTGAWISAQRTDDINALQAQMGHVEAQIRSRTEHLAATRAWSHAVHPKRLTGQAQADLAHYAQLVKSLGKGTGKYASRKRADIRRAMERCRPAVPVWIMPIYRIAEQLRVEPDMFDVVIVDEASQAGAEAAFLQYLAPKIVVIGDDRQVSPSAVGVDQQQIADLANQYLAGDRYKASWQDPKRSLFDEAMMRFGSRITLVEHRRCMPEIIGFSNRIAYEPDGVRLIPVRQYGADRLEPIKAIHVEDGYEVGSTNKVNPSERDAIVDQIEKCIADPAYDGKSMGVISLLGQHQARAIEKLLMERLPPEEWRARDLRCGDAADFQGSERDVMFLSMVKAADSGQRIGALTAEQYVQRYNVAASRAKDQMWLFHSITLSDLGHPEDMRFALLDYVYGVIGRRRPDRGISAAVVSEDIRAEPFDSLFEQRVYNRLVDRGYTVVPQYEASGYLIDLVIVGASGRLAVECDGDHWHGPARFEQDLARQRDLERCGWQFFRIRESAFYVEPERVLADLWATLEELNIRPSDWVEERLILEATVEVGDMEQPLGGMHELAWGEVLGEPLEVAAPPIDLRGPEPELGPLEVAAQPVIQLSKPERESERQQVAVLERPMRRREAPAGFDLLETYERASSAVLPALGCSRSDALDGVLGIVRVEGPVLGTRLQAAYVRAAGGSRVGKQIASELNSVITQAVRQGDLLADSPLGESGVKFRTYRLPGQPEVRVRELGPRTFDDVPPWELAALVADTAQVEGWDDQDSLHRSVLARLGLVRLTPHVRDRLDAVTDLATELDIYLEEARD